VSVRKLSAAPETTETPETIEAKETTETAETFKTTRASETATEKLSVHSIIRNRHFIRLEVVNWQLFQCILEIIHF
jgi:hypothetical protein